MTRFADGYYQLTGTAGQFVSNRLSDQGTTAFFSNAGGLSVKQQQSTS
jgi:hypothetical protein